MTNVVTDSKNHANRAVDTGQIDLCEVVQVRADQKHVVRVHVRGDVGGTFSARVLAPTSGDVNVPSVGDEVAVAYSKGGTPVVIGILYTDDDTVPGYKRDQHTVGHARTGSNVTIEQDGDIVAEHDNGTKIIIRSDAVVIETSDPIHLGGESGSPVARQGDAVEVNDPDSGTITGTITGGSSQVNSE